MERDINADKAYSVLSAILAHLHCPDDHPLPEGGELLAAFPLAKPDPDYGMSGPRWSNNPTPPGDGIDEPFPNYGQGPAQSSGAASGVMASVRGGSGGSGSPPVLAAPATGDGIDERVYECGLAVYDSLGLPELGNADATRKSNEAAVRKDRELRGADAPPATGAVLTDEELRAIYDAEEDEAPDEFTIEDGLRAVARAQRAKSGVVVSREHVVLAHEYRGEVVPVSALRSIGVTVEDRP